MKKFAVILAGCGVFDGAEIHEATLTMLAIKKLGADYQVFAPDIPQHHVINHLTGEEMRESRNVLVESARIARGNIKPLSQFHITDFDATIFPGGFGVAKNLCNYAFRGAESTVNPAVAAVIKATVEANKPLGAMCIAPAMLPKVLGNVAVTLGQGEEDAANIVAMGGVHHNATHGQVIKDPLRKIYTTPCYMLDASILDIATGTENLVKEMLKGE